MPYMGYTTMRRKRLRPSQVRYIRYGGSIFGKIGRFFKRGARKVGGVVTHLKPIAGAVKGPLIGAIKRSGLVSKLISRIPVVGGVAGKVAKRAGWGRRRRRRVGGRLSVVRW